MTGTELAELAETIRNRLVRLTIVRGHDEDAAHDIVQGAIIICLSDTHAYKSDAEAIEGLKRTTWSLSGLEGAKAKVRERHFTRLDPDDENDLENTSCNPTEEYQKKIDVGNALRALSEEDRELARLIFIEGWTFAETMLFAPSHCTSESLLNRYVNNVLKPKLRELLKGYAPKGES